MGGFPYFLFRVSKMSFSSSDDGSQNTSPWVFLFALIALVVSTVVGVVVCKRGMACTRARGVVAAQAPAAAAVDEDVASVRVEDGVVMFFFATGRQTLPPVPNAGRCGQGRGRGPHGRGVGFHDATGDAAMNAELAKSHCPGGAGAQTWAWPKIESTQSRKKREASGSDAQARRVEVMLSAS